MTNNSNKPKEISAKEISEKIAEWVTLVKSQWKQIIGVSLIGCIIGITFAWLKPISYDAKISFIVEEGKTATGSLGGLASLAGQFGVDVGAMSGGGVFSGDNITIYFKSPTLAREVLLSPYPNSKESIADVYSEVHKLKKGWAKNKKIGLINFPVEKAGIIYSRIQDSLILEMVKTINEKQFSVVKTDKKASFIDVTATMENEKLSKTYCELIVKKAVDKYIAIKTQRQYNTVVNLQHRADSVAALLNSKTYSSAKLQTTNSIMDINPLYKTNNVVQVESTLRDKTMLATIFASVTQNLELAKFTLSQETPVIQVVDYPLLPLKQNKLSKLKMGIIVGFVFGFLFVSRILIKKIYTDIKNA